MNTKNLSFWFGIIGLIAGILKDDDTLIILACTPFIIYHTECISERRQEKP